MKKIILNTAALNSAGVRCDAGSELTVGTGAKADIAPDVAAELVADGRASEVTAAPATQAPAADVPPVADKLDDIEATD